MRSNSIIRRALISVTDKTGIIAFARELVQRGVALLATGGSANLLAKAAIPVTEISDYTNFPEMMGGRIKTLHPKIHGGILGRRGQDDIIMEQYNIPPIDMVIVNLYPFADIVLQADCTLEKAIENIDIGGPAMVRAAAKNYNDVAVIVDNNDFDTLLNEMDLYQGTLTLKTRFKLAVKAFKYSAAYDNIVASYLSKSISPEFDDTTLMANDFPKTINLQFIKKQDLRYGENTHQHAAFYIEPTLKEASVSISRQLQGKMLSYNNIADTDTALECVKTFQEPACVIVKHANPCGVAVSHSLVNAYNRAYMADPISAFGGIIAFNRPLDHETAKAIIHRQFVEVIIAPHINADALNILSTKQNIRVLACGDWDKKSTRLDFKRVNGGLLVQEYDLEDIKATDLQIVTQRSPCKQEINDALFCWQVAKYVKSNAIVYAKELTTVGIGAGQMSRVYSAIIAGIKANDLNLQLHGAVMASDAFFPFRDSIDAAANIGITCVIQPGGSIRDNEVIDAANEHNMAMLFTHMRHFRH